MLLLRPTRRLNYFVHRLCQTRLNYYLSFLCELTTCIIFAKIACDLLPVSLLKILSCVSLGLLIFSLFEYIYHRFLFHAGPALFQDSHEAHHQHPRKFDASPFFVSPFLVSGIFLFLQYWDRAMAALVSGSIMFGYVLYGLLHHSLHRYRFQNGLYRKLVVHHALHHRYKKSNFGVTSPLWDFIFGTRHKHKKAPPKTHQ